MAKELDKYFPEREELEEEVLRWADEHAEEFAEQMEGLGHENPQVPKADPRVLAEHADKFHNDIKLERKNLEKVFASKINDKTSQKGRESIADRMKSRIEDIIEKTSLKNKTRLNQKLDEHRQRTFGITHYIWKTLGDGRVRPSHMANNGRPFVWNEPSEITGNPGDDWGCRCRAIPIDSQNIKEFIEQKIISQVKDASRQWNNFDFLYHAYFDGSDITLSQVGHLRNIIEFYGYKLEGGKFKAVNEQIIRQARLKKSGAFNYVFSRNYDFIPVLYSFGSGVVSGVFKGEVKTENGLMFIKGEVRYAYTDLFTDIARIRDRVISDTSDPYEFPEWFVSTTDLGAYIFRVTDFWTTSLEGIVKLNEEDSKY